MQSKYDPFDLEISVSPHGGIDEWQWTLSIGNGAPIEIGVVKGSRMDGIRAAREERLRLIGKAVEATRMTHSKHPRDPNQLAKKNPEPDIELRPDGWERFERAVGAAVKSGPKHRTTAKRPTRKATKKPGK